jgi:sterol desaturase/sphingolipid hydroxylase (fatty acid hydroxylase superfamily)
MAFIQRFKFTNRLVGNETEKGIVHPCHKYRLQDRFEADKHRRLLRRRIETGQGLSAEDEQMAATKQSEWNWSAWIFEGMVYVVPLLTWDILAPRRHRRLGAFGPPDTFTILGNVAFGLMLYDFFFFIGHFLMHKIPVLFNLVHKKHHKIREVRACEQVRLSIPEEVYDVGCSIVALNLMGAHPVSRSIYNCIIVFLLVELHW